jgi:hypothetical protein
MKRSCVTLVTILCLLVASQAQEKKPATVAFSEPALGERGTTRILYWDQAKNTAVGELTINFGRPVWKKEYEDPAAFGLATKGKVWRLGDNYWTVLDTNVPLKIAGRDVPVGLWYLGLYRAADGSTWSLAFIDPARARKIRLDPFAINDAPVEFKAPMASADAAALTEKLTISLTPQKEDIRNVTLKISWGRMQLTAPVQVSLD